MVHVAEKNEDTWYEILRHFNAGFDTTLSLPTGGQGVVVQMRSRTIPMAIRTCSRLIVTTVMAWTPTTASLTTGGIVTMASRSSSRNSLHFSLAFAGEFCFVSWPFQPPSILPASLRIRDKEIYFLSSKDFVSHKIIRNTQRVSNFFMASRT